MKIDRRSAGQTVPRLLVGLVACGLILALPLPAAAQKRGRKTPTEPAGPMGPGGAGSVEMGMGPGGAPGVGAYGPEGGVPGGYVPGIHGPAAGSPVPTGPGRWYEPAEASPTPWAAASVPREAVLEWAMTSTPARDDLPELESLLERAYETDPFVAEAQAQLQQAQAALERARMEVARKIVRTRAQWEVRRRAVQCLSDLLKKTPEDEKLLQQYVDARAKLAQIEMELPFLARPPQKKSRSGRPGPPIQYGQQAWPSYSVTPMRPAGPSPTSPRLAPLSADVRKSLQKTMDVQFEEVELGEFVEYLKRETGVNFSMAHPDLGAPLITLHLKSVTLASVFQAIEDAVPEVCFVVRPYGILVTDREHAGALGESEAMRALRQGEQPTLPPVPEFTQPQQPLLPPPQSKPPRASRPPRDAELPTFSPLPAPSQNGQLPVDEPESKPAGRKPPRR